MKNTIKAITATTLLAAFALTGCAANQDPVAETSDTSTPSSEPIGSTSPAKWEELSAAAKTAQIDQARGKGLSALIWGEHVEWINPNYPQEQKDWIKKQVQKFAHTDGQVIEFSGLGDPQQLKVTRQYIKDGLTQTVDIHYSTENGK